MLIMSFVFCCVNLIIFSVSGANYSYDFQRNGFSASDRSIPSSPFFSNFTRQRSSRDTFQKRPHHHHHRQSCSSSPAKAEVSPAVRSMTEKLVKEIILEYSMRERSIGYHIDEFVDLTHRGYTLIQKNFQEWQSTPPHFEAFISNITSILNDLRLLSSSILRHVDSINKLGISSGNIKMKLLTNTGISKARQRRTPHRHQSYHDVRLHNSRRQKRSTDNISDNEYWSPFEKAVSYLNATNAWYNFLQELSIVLGSYEMQKPEKFVEDGPFSGWEGRRNITGGNLKDALERMLQEYSLNSLKDSLISHLISTVNLARLNFVNEIITATLLTSTVCSHTSKYVYVVGSYVSVSSVLKCMKSQIHHAVAVAANKIFIDVDLDSVTINKGKHFNVTIIAPYWEIVGENRVINISAPPRNSKGKGGGDPGSPGESGGNFYGIAHNISTNGSKLQIIANGGEGGAGHAGGYHPVQIGCESPRKTVEEECLFECEVGCSPNEACLCPECDYFCCSPTVHFIYNGKDGGQGGIGGNYGCVEVVSTTRVSLQGIIAVERNAGQNGSAGAGGKGMTTTTAPPQSELTAAGIIQINGNKNNYCARNSSEIVSPTPSAKDGEDGKDPRPPKPPGSIQTELRSIVWGSRKFKAMVLTSSHIFSRPGILSVIQYFDNNSTIQVEYRIGDFLGEYFDLQEQSSNISSHVLPELFYNSLSKRSLKWFAENTTKGGDEMRLTSFLYSTTLAKKLAITHPFQPDTQSDIFHFLYFELEVLTEMMAMGSNSNLYEQFELSLAYLRYYHEQFSQIFQQAVLFSEEFVYHEVHLTEKYFKHVTAQLLKDIKKYKGDGNQDGLVEARKKLLTNTILNSLFAVVKLAAISFSFWNPIGAAVVSGANLSHCMKHYGSAALSKEGQRDSKVDLPQFVLDANSRGAHRVRKVTAYSFRGLLGELKAARTILSPFPEDFKEVLAEIKRINETASVMASDPKNNTDQFPPQENVHAFKVLLSGLTFIKGAQKNLSSLLESKMGGAGNKNQKDAARLAYGIFLIDSQFFNQIGSEKEDIMEATEQILMVTKEITIVNAHAERLQAEMIPDMNNLLVELSNLMTDRLSQAILTIRWRMQSAILGTRLYLDQTFPDQDEFKLRLQNALQMLDEATTSFVRFYEHLQDNYDQTAVFNFVKTAVQNKDFYFGNSTNSTIQEATQALRYNLLGQLLVKRHQRVSSLFRYWKFPVVTADLCRSYKNVISNGLVFSGMSDILTFLQILIKVTKQMINIREQYPDVNRFGNFELFTWENATHWSRIKSLLQGESIHLFSDALRGLELCEAIKIHRFNFSFTSTAGNKTLDKEMKEAIDHFYITLSHQGNSYYKLGDEIKILHGNAFNVSFSFKLHKDGSPILQNGVYGGLITGNYTLSPYAFYKMQIEPLGSETNFSVFADKFKLFNMNLEGNGTCVDKNFNFKGHYSPDCSDYFPDEKARQVGSLDYGGGTSNLDNLLQELPRIAMSRKYDFQKILPAEE